MWRELWPAIRDGLLMLILLLIVVAFLYDLSQAAYWLGQLVRNRE